MKLLKSILVYLGLGISMLLAFIFMFLEFRSLFAGDFTLMSNPTSSFFAILFRGLYFLSIIALAVFIILFRTHNKKICIILFAISIALFIGSLLSFIHFHLPVALAIVAINVIHVVITSIGFFKKEKDTCSIN